MNHELQKILMTPEETRDSLWEIRFFQEFTKSHVDLLSDDPQTGPDGWPYLLVSTNISDKGEPFQNILRWLSEKGIGLAVNPSKEYPDYVFTYGMIWHFRETGLFYRDQADIKSGTVILGSQEIQQAGPPTETFLPKYVRSVLKDFFRDQGLHAVKVLVIQTENNFYDLAFSLESLGSPPESERAGIAEALSWFLPPHYSILIVSETGLPEFTIL